MRRGGFCPVFQIRSPNEAQDRALDFSSLYGGRMRVAEAVIPFVAILAVSWLMLASRDADEDHASEHVGNRVQLGRRNHWFRDGSVWDCLARASRARPTLFSAQHPLRDPLGNDCRLSRAGFFHALDEQLV